MIGSAVDLEALVRLEIPDADGAVAGAGDSLALVKLAAVDAVGVAVQVDGGRVASLPPLVDLSPSREHALPLLPRRRVSVDGLANTGTSHLNGLGRYMDLWFVLSEENIAPDVRRRGEFLPAAGYRLGVDQGCCVEVGQDGGCELGRKALKRVT